MDTSQPARAIWLLPLMVPSADSRARSFSNIRIAIRPISSCTAFLRTVSSRLAFLASFVSVVLALSFGLVCASGSISWINPLTGGGAIEAALCLCAAVFHVRVLRPH